MGACCSVETPHKPRRSKNTTSETPTLIMSNTTPQSTTPIFAQFSSENLVLGAGVAIFHIASGRVVLCSAEDRYGRTYYFLPKGRRDAGEESGRGAEREGYEEVCLRFVSQFLTTSRPTSRSLKRCELPLTSRLDSPATVTASSLFRLSTGNLKLIRVYTPSL